MCKEYGSPDSFGEVRRLQQQLCTQHFQILKHNRLIFHPYIRVRENRRRTLVKIDHHDATTVLFKCHSSHRHSIKLWNAVYTRCSSKIQFPILMESPICSCLFLVDGNLLDSRQTLAELGELFPGRCQVEFPAKNIVLEKLETRTTLGNG